MGALFPNTPREWGDSGPGWTPVGDATAGQDAVDEVLTRSLLAATDRSALEAQAAELIARLEQRPGTTALGELVVITGMHDSEFAAGFLAAGAEPVPPLLDKSSTRSMGGHS